MPAHRRVRPVRPAVAGRVVLWGAAVLGLGAGPLVGIASAAPTAVDYNCSDFTYQEDAQAKLLPGDPYRLDADHDGRACQNLPHRGSSATTPVTQKPVTQPVLTQPGGTQHASTQHTARATRGTSSSPARTTRAAINDLDCRDFTSRAQAQSVLDRDHSDPNRLDADHDGTACESYDYGSSSTPVRSVANTGDTATGSSSAATGSAVDTTAADVPVGGVAAGDGSTGGSGGDALWYGLLGSAAVAGAAGAHQFVGGRRRRV